MTDSHQPTPSYISRNGLTIAYVLLKKKLGRFLENSHISPLEDFYEKVGRALGLSQNQYTLMNSEVEQFYTDQMSETNFVAITESRLVRAAISPVNSPTAALTVCPLGNGKSINTGHPGLTSAELKLLSIVWDMYSVTPEILAVCTKIPRLCGMCIWQMFLCLDKECSNNVAVEDVYELVNLIFKANGHSIEPTTVDEWFCGERTVDFRCFFQCIVEGYTGLLQTDTIQELYTILCLKQLKQGKMMKKGHLVHNWKWRWFILTTNDVKYYESQDSLIPKGCINITGLSQVQIMTETKGHLYKFRVVDGVTNTPTEISCPDEQTRREWIDCVRLAIKLNMIEGRNFVHKYAQALETLPKSARGAIMKKLKDATTSPTTSPTHKALSASKSVPVNNTPSAGNGKGRRKLPMTPDNSGLLPLQEEHRPMPPQRHSLDDGLGDEPPPLPPQRLDSGDIRSLYDQIGRTPLAQYDIIGVKAPTTKSPKSSLRRTSSAGDLEESIKHLQVGEGEYALVSKTAKKSKKTNAPEQPTAVDPRTRNTEPGNRPRKKKSPPMPFQNKKSQQATSSSEHMLSFEESNRSQPVSVKVSNQNMSYAELRFSHGGSDDYETATVSPATAGSSNLVRGGEEPPPPQIPHDPKTKYGYSTIIFDEAKQKDVIAAEKLKKERGAPPPLPNKYKGDVTNLKAKKLRQYLSDSNTSSYSKEPKYQGKARPISAGVKRTPATAALIGQNGVNSYSAGSGDYEEVGFEEDKEEFENVPRKPRDEVDAPRDQRVLVLPSDKRGSGGYENVDLEPRNKLDHVVPDRVDRQNQPLPPLPSQKPPQLAATRPSHLYQQQQTGNVTPPQPKPRITPRKGVPTPNTNTPPVPPRKTS